MLIKNLKIFGICILCVFISFSLGEHVNYKSWWFSSLLFPFLGGIIYTNWIREIK